MHDGETQCDHVEVPEQRRLQGVDSGRDGDEEPRNCKNCTTSSNTIKSFKVPGSLVASIASLRHGGVHKVLASTIFSGQELPPLFFFKVLRCM